MTKGNGNVTTNAFQADGALKSMREETSTGALVASHAYTYDPLDRTASKPTTGTDGKTTDYTYLGLSKEVLGEEVAGELTKSYQYSPWGQRLSQVSHKADTESGVEAGETGYYGYNAHTDVETVTDDTSKTVATYGYTAYGENDESEFTGIDKPDPGRGPGLQGVDSVIAQVGQFVISPGK